MIATVAHRSERPGEPLDRPQRGGAEGKRSEQYNATSERRIVHAHARGAQS